MRYHRFAPSLILAASLLWGAPAHASLFEIDLSPYANLGFQNSWFINGGEFTPIIGSTTGNQGSSVPFLVANAPDTLGNGGNNNFWFGLYGGPGNQLGGAPLTLTIPIGISGATTVYTLADNTFGAAGVDEYSITFTPTVGTPITEQYVGAFNTKDYNLNCGTTGCDTTPAANYWFVDSSGSQWLQEVAWELPAGFGTLASATITQESTGDGAILAGLTVSTNPVPEPASLSLFAAALAFLAILVLRRKRG